MRRVALGREGLQVGAIGFGAWGLSGDYGPADDGESIAVLRRALDLGVDLLDTADVYGHGHNERLVGQAIRGRRDRVVLATKVGVVHDSREGISVCGRPEHVRSAFAACVGRLDVDHVDLLYLHRADPEVPIEETVGAMAGLVGEGSVRYLGLSEVGSDLVRRAHAVHPLTAVQSEYSLWTREPERDVLPTLAELGIGLVAFGPLGRGFLAGAVRSADELAEGDFRRSLPRFQAGNVERNLTLLDRPGRLAAARCLTPGQLALAWVLAQGAVPIPGTRRLAHLEANVEAAGVRLGPDDLAELDAAFPPGTAAGTRYPPRLAAKAAGQAS